MVVKRLKNTLLLGAIAAVSLRAAFLVLDPVYTPGWNPATGQALPIYTHWRPAIDWVYLVAAYIQLPVQLAAQLVLMAAPSLHSDVFPVMASSKLAPYLAKVTEWAPMLKLPTGSPTHWLPGFVDWVSLATALLLWPLIPLTDWLYSATRNLVWAILIEFSFSEKKQLAYREALSKRAAELNNLSMQYRSLSKEATLMAESIITDELTKVHNKRFFLNKIEEVFRRCRENRLLCTLVMLDIDHFKRINDTHGHLVGDEVLAGFGKAAKAHIPSGCFLCRFGGEEFAVIMQGKPLAEGTETAEAIRRAISELRFESVPELRVTSSAGVACIDFDSAAAQALTVPTDLISLADDELYRAKLEGRNRCCIRMVGNEANAPAVSATGLPGPHSSDSASTGARLPGPAVALPPEYLAPEPPASITPSAESDEAFWARLNPIPTATSATEAQLAEPLHPERLPLSTPQASSVGGPTKGTQPDFWQQSWPGLPEGASPPELDKEALDWSPLPLPDNTASSADRLLSNETLREWTDVLNANPLELTEPADTAFPLDTDPAGLLPTSLGAVHPMPEATVTPPVLPEGSTGLDPAQQAIAWMEESLRQSAAAALPVGVDNTDDNASASMLTAGEPTLTPEAGENLTLAHSAAWEEWTTLLPGPTTATDEPEESPLAAAQMSQPFAQEDADVLALADSVLTHLQQAFSQDGLSDFPAGDEPDTVIQLVDDADEEPATVPVAESPTAATGTIAADNRIDDNISPEDIKTLWAKAFREPGAQSRPFNLQNE